MGKELMASETKDSGCRRPEDNSLRFICPGCDGRIDPASMVNVAIIGPGCSGPRMRELFFCRKCRRYVDEMCLHGLGGTFGPTFCPACDGELVRSRKSAKMSWEERQ